METASPRVGQPATSRRGMCRQSEGVLLGISMTCMEAGTGGVGIPAGQRGSLEWIQVDCLHSSQGNAEGLNHLSREEVHPI